MKFTKNINTFLFNTSYPFLNKVLSAYKEFDKVLETNVDLDAFYETEIKDDQEKKQKYKDIFLKLLRNLEIFVNNGYKGPQLQEYCTYFYHWLYLRTKGYNADLLISIIFDEFEKKKLPRNKYICPYDSYNKQKDIFKSKDLVKLSYFKLNHESIKDILNKQEKPNYCLCQKYLEECVNTYRTVNASHCSNTQKEKNKELCSELTQFNSYYSYLTSDSTIREKIPNIYTGERELELLNCSPKGERSGLISDAASQAVSDVKTLPTALGTIAGATSVLALLYKVNAKIILNV
ncbi:hypothetical protein PVNG_02161 [Plasmodium vivax North Korean]|uniref:VIR protein n=1 Tax=Plasmodium vivax North Korean TaxID=1035514 RepID=A0A0J9WDP7_PLAVI|nr:hypothetical protein PVNG_02161 [Plasmodium vivax North Korean]